MTNKTFAPQRHQILQQFSADNSVVAMLSRRIRQGLKKEIDLVRIKTYADWVFENQIKPQFEIEEKYFFSVLDDQDKLKKRALAEHRKLERLFNEKVDISRALHLIEELLDLHIRYEEKILIDHLQGSIQSADIHALEVLKKEPLKNRFWKDQFWK